MTEQGMTPKERWLAVLNREIPDHLPMDYWGTPETTQSLLNYLGCSNIWEMFEALHIDGVCAVEPEYIGPKLIPNHDVYGCGYEDVVYGGGTYQECVFHPLSDFQSVYEIEEHYSWPIPDLFDYSVIPDQIKGKEAHPIRGGGSEPFFRYTQLRGHTQAYRDLIKNPDIAHYCLEKLFYFHYEDTKRIYEEIPGQVTFSYIAEDFGGQNGLLFSPQMIAEYFLNGMKQMVELAHENDVYAFCHSDGAIREIIPELLDIDIDILNPVQWRCAGMNREGLKADFGDRVVFHGGMDNQQTLAFGSLADIRAEVKYNLEVMGKGGGYILAPCHNIQAISPPGNIVAMYEAGYRYGRLEQKTMVRGSRHSVDLFSQKRW
jgi:uroporphyrinogen decarboxylase